jgi:hypothetical protein
MICLTGPGIVLGIPMIIAGICAPLLGPLLGMSVVRGKCPWCEAAISSIGPINVFYCHVCNRKIAVTQKRELVRAE